jgi:hypothetical protein
MTHHLGKNQLTRVHRSEPRDPLPGATMTAAGVEIVNILKSVLFTNRSGTYMLPLNQRWDRPDRRYCCSSGEGYTQRNLRARFDLRQVLE